jgi:hypothetical protein
MNAHTKPEEDQYDFWRRRLAGETIPIHDGEPQAGFYRLTYKAEPDRPVAYWYGKDGKIRCRIGNTDVNELIAAERWPWASKRPITHEVYKVVVAGGHWPDQHQAVSNSIAAPPDNSIESLTDAIESLARVANDMIGQGGAKTQAEADQAADVANKLADYQKQADAARKAEKKPLDDAAAEVQQKWAPVITLADIYRQVKAKVITPFLTAKADAERKAREDTAKAGQPEPAPERQRSTTTAGTRGKTVALRTVKKVEITDRAALLAYFADGEAMTAFLQDMAEKAVRVGVTPPGVKVTETKVAA